MENFHLHNALGIDFDETLVGNSPTKEVLWSWIYKNKQRKKFFIITFRTGTWLEKVWNDLEVEAKFIVPAFSGVYSVPVDAKDAYFEYSKLKKKAHKPKNKERMNQIYPLYTAFREWKGKKAKELGCSVLVDDDRQNTLPGCEKFGVDYVHPGDFRVW